MKKVIRLIDEDSNIWQLFEGDVSEEEYTVLDKLDLEDDEYCVWKQSLLVTGNLSMLDASAVQNCKAQVASAFESFNTSYELTADLIDDYDVLAKEEKRLIHAIRSLNLRRRVLGLH